MKKNIRFIYIIETLILIFIILFKIFIINHYRNLIDIVSIIFWIFIFIIFLLKFKLPKDKNYYKSATIRLVIICLMALVIMIYAIGLITGFTEFVYSHKLVKIIKNVLPVILLIVPQELIRYIIAKTTQDDIKPIAFYTLLIIILNTVMEISFFSFYSGEQIFLFVFTKFLPLVADQLLYSYLAYNVSYVPSLILRIPFETYYYILPFFPSLGDYVTSVVYIMFPYIIYINVNKYMSYKEKNKNYLRKMSNTILSLPILVFLIIVVILVSGIFRIQLLAIGSNSMVPEYARGDAIIIEKYTKEEINQIQVGDIIVYKHNDIIVTHRVVKMSKSKDDIIFKTKGDNNEIEDGFNVHTSDVIGIVKRKIKYLGYPTIILSEFMNKE